MFDETARVEQLKDRFEERSRRAIRLKAGRATAFYLLISVIFCTEVYAQGDGSSISFEHRDRMRNDEVFVQATGLAFGRGGI